MKQLIIGLSLLLLYGFTIAESLAEDYVPHKLSWDRPTNRENGVIIAADEPLTYFIWGKINANQGDDWRIIAAKIDGIEFVHIIDAGRTGLDGHTIDYKVVTCDKYPQDGISQENCSDESNVQFITIQLLSVPPESGAPKPPYMHPPTYVYPEGYVPPVTTQPVSVQSTTVNSVTVDPYLGY